MIRFLAYISMRLLFLFSNIRNKNNCLDFNNIDSVLFIETSKMGDVVAMLPLLQSFYNYKPNIKINVAIDSQYSDILKGITFISSLILLEETRTFGGFNKARIIIRNTKVNLAVSVSPSYRNALLTLCSKSKFKIGYFDSRTSTTPFLYKTRIKAVGFKLKSEIKYFKENIIERCIKIARALEIPISIKYPEFFISNTYCNEIKHFISNLNIQNEKYIVIHPFSGWEYRNWNLYNYLLLANHFINEGFIVVMIGSTEEKEKVESSCFQNKSAIIFLYGEQLTKLILTIKGSKLFIGNDSGPLHLATLLGIPCIGLFGPASPNLTAPISEKNRYLYKQTDCSPCDQTKCVKPQNPCMSLLTIDEVIEAANKLLNNSA